MAAAAAVVKGEELTEGGEKLVVRLFIQITLVILTVILLLLLQYVLLRV